MKKFILTVISCFLFVNIYSQVSISPEVISNAGDHFTGTNSMISWTLGELAIETYTGSNVTLTQGFHQNSYEIVSIDKFTFPEFEIAVFPNPTSDYVNYEIRSEQEEFNKLNVEIIDMQGKTLLKKKITSTKGKFSLQSFSNNIYFLKILTDSGKPVKVFKIQKTR